MPRKSSPRSVSIADERSLLARGTPAAPRRLRIVEMAASAGRPDALRKLISALPADGSITYILVQHLDQTQKHLMVELLVKYTATPVSQVTQDAPLCSRKIQSKLNTTTCRKAQWQTGVSTSC